MTSLRNCQNLTERCQMLAPDNDSEVGVRAAWWLKTAIGPHAAKNLQDAQAKAGMEVASERTIARILAGDVSDKQLRQLCRLFGWRFASFVLQPLCGPLADGDAELAYLDQIENDRRLARAAVDMALDAPVRGSRDPMVAHGSVGGLPAGSYRLGGNDARDHHGAESDYATPLGRAARELMALRGAVDLNEEIGLGAVGERQAVLLDAWGASGGELSDSLIGAIEASGFSGLASVFDNQMRVRRIGPAVGLWNAEQRLEAVGRDMGELPAPLPYLQAVRESLEAAVGQRIALHHRIKVRIGDVAKTYRRLALPCMRSGLILSVSMLEAA